jgi:hypothetical protein
MYHQNPGLKTVHSLGASRWLCEAMRTRVVWWPPDLLCSLQERYGRLQHTLGCSCEILHDLLLVGENVQLFLDVLPHRLARGFGRLAESLGLLA